MNKKKHLTFVSNKNAKQQHFIYNLAAKLKSFLFFYVQRKKKSFAGEKLSRSSTAPMDAH